MKRTILSKRTILWSVSKRNFFYNKPLDCTPTPATLAQSEERKGSNFAIRQPCDKEEEEEGDEDDRETFDTQLPTRHSVRAFHIEMPVLPGCSVFKDSKKRLELGCVNSRCSHRNSGCWIMQPKTCLFDHPCTFWYNYQLSLKKIIVCYCCSTSEPLSSCPAATSWRRTSCRRSC